MGSEGTHAHEGAEARGNRKRGWPRAALLITIGALLLTTASIRLVPYVRTRQQTASLLAPQPAASPAGADPTPASLSSALASDRPAAQTADGDQESAESADDAMSDLASVPLVPTPAAPPTRLVIPAISVDALVVPISQRPLNADGVSLAIPQVPARGAAGWHDGSAALGVAGNTVLSGHNAGFGEVFRDLYLLEDGDMIIAYSGDTPYVHTVSQVVLLREEGQSVEARRRNARYVEQTSDERLTLVTCHPYGSLRYRLVVIAHPGISPTGLTTLRAPSED